MSEPVVEMVRVSPAEFVSHLDRWPLVTSVSQLMPLENSGGRYAQTGYFSVAEVQGTKLIPDTPNLLAAIRKAPTKSGGQRDTLYFINLNARPEALGASHETDDVHI